MKTVSKFSSEVRYFLYAFKFFGLSPFSVNKLWNILLISHSFLLLVVIIFLILSAFIWSHIFDQSTGTLASIVGRLVFCGLVATNLIMLVQGLVFRQEASQIEDRFDDIYTLLTQKLFVEISPQRLKVKLFWKIFAIFAFLLAVKIFNIVSLSYYNEHLGYILHSLWLIIIIRARCIQNIFLVDLINEYLTFLNWKLEEIIAHKSDQAPLDAPFFMKYPHNDFRHLKKSPYEELVILKDVYGKIWDIANLINDAFGWSLLAIATQNFIEFTCNGYWLFLAMDEKTSGITAISKIYWGDAVKLNDYKNAFIDKLQMQFAR